MSITSLSLNESSLLQLWKCHADMDSIRKWEVS